LLRAQRGLHPLALGSLGLRSQEEARILERTRHHARQGLEQGEVPLVEGASAPRLDADDPAQGAPEADRDAGLRLHARERRDEVRIGARVEHQRGPERAGHAPDHTGFRGELLDGRGIAQLGSQVQAPVLTQEVDARQLVPEAGLELADDQLRQGRGVERRGDLGRDRLQRGQRLLGSTPLRHLLLGARPRGLFLREAGALRVRSLLL
jgi:hypothetical protein